MCVYVCVCVCVFVCKYVCMYVYVCVFVCVWGYDEKDAQHFFIFCPNQFQATLQGQPREATDLVYSRVANQADQKNSALPKIQMSNHSFDNQKSGEEFLPKTTLGYLEEISID